MSQHDLFSDHARPAPVTTPRPEEVRSRLEKIVDEARKAEVMPWEPSQVSLYRTIVPQMSNWLPADEAERWRAEFEAEVSRLENLAA